MAPHPPHPIAGATTHPISPETHGSGRPQGHLGIGVSSLHLFSSALAHTLTLSQVVILHTLVSHSTFLPIEVDHGHLMRVHPPKMFPQLYFNKPYDTRVQNLLYLVIEQHPLWRPTVAFEEPHAVVRQLSVAKLLLKGRVDKQTSNGDFYV